MQVNIDAYGVWWGVTLTTLCRAQIHLYHACMETQHCSPPQSDVYENSLIHQTRICPYPPLMDNIYSACLVKQVLVPILDGRAHNEAVLMWLVGSLHNSLCYVFHVLVILFFSVSFNRVLCYI